MVATRKNNKQQLLEELKKQKALLPKSPNRFSDDDYEEPAVDSKFLLEDPIFEAVKQFEDNTNFDSYIKK